MAKFSLEIVTPDRSFFSGQVDMAIVRGQEGDLAILNKMAPIATPLGIGKATIIDEGQEKVALLIEGYLTVVDNKATIVTDCAQWPEEIDEARAQAAKSRAERRIKEKKSQIDIIRAESSLKRALARIEVCKYCD